jgi:hypothetical protein
MITGGAGASGPDRVGGRVVPDALSGLHDETFTRGAAGRSQLDGSKNRWPFAANGQLRIAGDRQWRGNRVFLDSDERLRARSAAGDPLERLVLVVDFEVFRVALEAALSRSDRLRGGRPPYDPVVMFKILVVQTLYPLSDDQTEYQLSERLSFMRFVGLALHGPGARCQDDLALSRAAGAGRRG